MTTRINAIQNEEATGKAKELLDAVQNKLGMTPNLMKTFANSPAVLEGYLALNESLGSTLSATLREQLAITVANSNSCHYCVSAHTAIGKMSGLTETELSAARNADSVDPRAKTAMIFARRVLAERGSVTDDDINTVRKAGYGDKEITEIVAHVALNVLTNYFNNVARTEIDFPEIALAAG
ncbi:MAG: carboxymuconolactone decarboxylase family protein [Pyrinomonadaceae bacterium]